MTDHAATGPMTWVFDDAGLGQLEEAIISAYEVVWDTETTGLVKFAEEGGKANGGVGARLSLATFTLPQRNAQGDWDGQDPITWILPLSHPDSPFRGHWRETARRMMELIRHHDKALVGHNIKYDVVYGWSCTGCSLVKQIAWDTADGSRLIESGLSAKLGDAAARAFGIPSWKDFDLSKPGASEKIPLFELGEYGARDTYWTWKLKRHQQALMFLLPDSDDEPIGTEEVLMARLGNLATWVAMPTVTSLSQVEMNGFALDVELTKQTLAEDWAARQKALETVAHWYELDDMAGLVDLKPDQVSTAPTAHWFKRLTEHAVEKGELQILEATPKGAPSWTKSVLKKLAKQHGQESLAGQIKAERHHKKRSEFLSSWLSYVTPDGIIHAGYNTGMATGRLSSSGPNMQQINKLLRPMFVPRPGYCIADFDFSQIEMRIAAFISRSEPMIAAFQNDHDLHRLLAAEVVGCAPEDVTGEQRQMAKAVNFGLLFGLGAAGLQGYAEDSYDVTMTRDEAMTFYNAYFEKWAGLREWHATVEGILMRDGRSVSPLGRVRTFAGGGGPNDRNAAINAPVQGMASDLMQIAMADIQGLLPAGTGRGKVEGVRVVGTVHDSGVMELPIDNWEPIALEVKHRMEDLNPLIAKLGVQLDVPIKVEATIGTRWGLDDIGEVA